MDTRGNHIDSDINIYPTATPIQKYLVEAFESTANKSDWRFFNVPNGDDTKMRIEIHNNQIPYHFPFADIWELLRKVF